MRSVVRAAVATLAIAIVAAPARADDGPSNPPQAPPTMSLGGVLEVAVRQSPTLELAAIDVDIADAAVLEAAGIDDWVLGADLSVSRFHLTSEDDTGMETSGDFDTFDANGTLSRSLPTGGRVSVGVQTSFDDNPFSITGGEWSHGLTAQVSQPLLRGRGEAIARASQRQARISRDAAELERRASAITVLRDVVGAYWSLAFATRDLEIRRGSLELARERLRITRASIDAGATAPTEALAVEQIIATREEEIVSAELSLLERALSLRRLAGLEIGPGNLELAAAAPLEVEPREFDLDALLEEAYANSPELAALAKREENATITVEVTDNGLLPRLDASVSGGPSGVNESFTAALGDMAQFKSYQVRGALSFEHTLGNRAQKGIDRQARARLTQAKITTADAKQQIARALASAVARARVAGKRMELSKKAIELAEKNVDAEKARFDLGRATNFDIAQRQEELKLAQLRYAGATVDYLGAVAEIDAITGRLLDKYGVTLAPR